MTIAHFPNRVSLVSRLGSPANAVGRIRSLFICFLVLLSVIAAAEIAASHVATHKSAALAAVAWIVVSAWWLYRHQQPSLVLDLADCIALGVVAWCVGDASDLMSVLFPVVFFTSLYGSRRRAVVRTGLWSSAFAIGMVLSGGALTIVPANVAGIIIAAVVMRMLGVIMARQQLAIADLATLTWSGAKLVGAVSRHEIDQIVLEAACRLGGDDPTIAAAILSTSADDRVVVTAARGFHSADLVGVSLLAADVRPDRVTRRLDYPSKYFNQLMSAPLMVQGETTGAVALGTRSTLHDDLGRTLAALASQMTLSLENLASSSRFRSLVQNSHDVFTIVSPEEKVTYQSPSFGRMTGIDPATTIDELVVNLVHPDDANALRHHLASRSQAHLSLRLRHADGGWRQAEIVCTDLLLDPGVNGWVMNIRDVSERTALEVRLRQVHKLEAVGRLAAGVAHEINTPVQFIGDNLQFLSESFKTLVDLLDQCRASLAQGETQLSQAKRIEILTAAEQDADLDFIRSEIPGAIAQSQDGVSRVSSIVRAMKAFAHPDRATQEWADLDEALRSTLSLARSEIKNVADVNAELGNLPSVLCFRGALNQVFLNLLVNAGHAIAAANAQCGARGTITVRTRREGDDVVISVSDTGVGIPEDVRSKVFEPFFTTKDVGEGTGQGLSLASSIIDRHEGSLTFETEVGVGTTFVIRLPINGLRATRVVDAMAGVA